MNEINKAFLKRIKKFDNKLLLTTANVFKILNRVTEVARSSKFQKNYNTVLLELKDRGLFKE